MLAPIFGGFAVEHDGRLPTWIVALLAADFVSPGLASFASQRGSMTWTA